MVKVGNKRGHSQVVDPLVASATILSLERQNLSDDCAEFTARGGNSVSGRSITCREDFARNDEGRSIRPEVLEEVRQTVQEHEHLLQLRSGVEFSVRET